MEHRKLKKFESDKTVILRLVCAVFENYSDATSSNEQETVRSYFKTKYGFYCSGEIAHNIILKCRNEQEKTYETIIKIVDEFKACEYKNYK